MYQPVFFITLTTSWRNASLDDLEIGYRRFQHRFAQHFKGHWQFREGYERPPNPHIHSVPSVRAEEWDDLEYEAFMLRMGSRRFAKRFWQYGHVEIERYDVGRFAHRGFYYAEKHIQRPNAGEVICGDHRHRKKPCPHRLAISRDNALVKAKTMLMKPERVTISQLLVS
jgi:hypothetical protein